MKTYEDVCLVCPNSCLLKIEVDEGKVTVYGNRCPRGESYAASELKNPMRVLTTTVALTGAAEKRLPVISNGEMPFKRLRECLDAVHKLRVDAPVHEGEVLIENVCGTGVDIVSAKTIGDWKGRE